MVTNDKSKQQNKRKLRIIFAQSFLMFIVSLVLLGTAVYAWYIQNISTDVSGFELSTDSTKIVIADTFTITRGVIHNGEANPTNIYTYKKDIDNVYYLWNTATSSFILDSETGLKQGVELGGLLPSEYLEFDVAYTRQGEAKDLVYDVMLCGISGSTFTVEDTIYTILGVYKVNTISIVDGQPVFGNDIWLDDYSDQQSPPSTVILQDNVAWASDTSTINVRFRMTLDMTQLSNANLPPNILSELSMNIGGLYVAVAN